MALFKIFKGLSDNFGKENNETKKTKEGYAYFTPDDGRFFIDITSDQDPIIGTSTKLGANRIWINSGNLDNLVLDCGTAFGWSANQIKILDASNIITTNEYLVCSFGEPITEKTEVIKIYDAGSSLY